jgi:hypothetical protein
MNPTRLLLTIAIVGLVAAPAAHAQKGGSTKPGRYTDFHDVDEVTIVQPFQSKNYNRIVVQRLNTSGAPLPEPSDNSYNDVKAALANSTTPFMEGVREKAGMQVQGGPGGPGSLIIRARITKSDPGSQAARYWASFGAGAAKVSISGEIVDGGTGKVLARFTQERRSGFGLFGGGYRELLDRTLKQIGGDVAGLIRAM